MIFGLKKNSIVNATTWIVFCLGVNVVGIHFVSCSRDISRIVQAQKEDEIEQIVVVQSLMPPVIDSSGIAIPVKGKGVGLDTSTIVVDLPPTFPSVVDEKRIIRHSGGSIMLHNGDEVVGSFEVRPGSIQSDTTIQITSYSLAVMGLDVREYHFSPHGLQFSQKAELILSGSLFKKSDGSPADEIFWLYFNPDTGKWDMQGTILKDIDGNFHIEMEHFSIYRAATKNGVGLSQGGQVTTNSK